MSLDPYMDPRDQPFEISYDLLVGELSPEAVEGLIDSYCTQYHGLNETESPIENRDLVKKALSNGDLSAWFDPKDGSVSLHPKASNQLR